VALNSWVIDNGWTGSFSWDSANGGSTSIQGFATDSSVNIGQTVHFKINTASPSYHVDIYRIGYYQGNGARFIGSATVSATLPQTQPSCLNDVATQLLDCGNWAESASWAVPGVGQLVYDSINNRDLIVIKNVVILFTVLVLVVNLLVDLAYAFLDPRPRVRT
jgi:hypothetical protein